MRTIRTALAIGVAAAGLLAAPTGALAAGPQELPAAACNQGTARAAENAPTRKAAEAVPHVEHAYPVPVPYCHHFNPTAEPPTLP